MALNFPNAPTNGQVFVDTNGTSWTYETATNSWTSNNASSAPTWSKTGNVLSPKTAGDVVSVSAGTEAAPGLTPVGDVNTGIYSPGPDQLAISTGGTGRLFVAASGNVGVGTVSPANTLDIVRTSSTSNSSISVRNLSTTGNSNAVVSLSGNSGASGLQLLVDGLGTVVGTTCARIATIASHPLLLGTNNAERLRITNDGYLRMAAGSGGIQFNGDTAAANALNDYEEGTHTATLTPSVSGTITLDSRYQTLAYTKIGRLVSLRGTLIASSASSPVGYVNVSLPFAAASVSGIGYAGGSVFVDQGTGVNINQYVVIVNGASARIYLGNNTGLQSTSAQAIGAGGQIYLDITYHV